MLLIYESDLTMRIMVYRYPVKINHTYIMIFKEYSILHYEIEKIFCPIFGKQNIHNEGLDSIKIFLTARTQEDYDDTKSRLGSEP